MSDADDAVTCEVCGLYDASVKFIPSSEMNMCSECAKPDEQRRA